MMAGILPTSPDESATPPLTGPVALSGRRPQWVLALLVLVYVLHHIDRNVLLILLEPIRREFGLTDTQIGSLSGIAYALPFALAGIPLGALADRLTRTRLLAGFVFLWSLFTALTGFARGFGTLVTARAAIGAAEAGAPPAILSLISDTFPPRSRPAALSILFTGPLVGLLLGSLIGGLAASAVGWRGALWVVATPGILMAAVLMLVPEPVRGTFDSAGGAPRSRESFGTVLRFAFGHAQVRNTVLGMMFASVAAIGLASWVPVLLMRVHGMPVQVAGAMTAFGVGLPGGLGGLMAAWIASRYARGRPDRLLLLCGTAVGISIPLAVIGVLASSSTTTIVWLALWSFTSTMFIGPGHSLYLSWAPPQIRGALSATVVVACNLMGAGLGPYIVGSLSDGLRAAGDLHALPHALACLALVGLLPSALFLTAAHRESNSSLNISP
jgi:predicted MFS family arabinose efflux permease